MSQQPRKRSPFARWMWERGLKPKDGVEPLGVSWQSIRTYALDFGDPGRVIPSSEILERIFAWTEGAITPDSFHEFTPKPADEDWVSRSFLEAPDPV